MANFKSGAQTLSEIGALLADFKMEMPPIFFMKLTHGALGFGHILNQMHIFQVKLTLRAFGFGQILNQVHTFLREIVSQRACNLADFKGPFLKCSVSCLLAIKGPDLK